MGPLTPLNNIRLNIDLDELNKCFSNEVDVGYFTTADYTQDQLREIRNIIDGEFMLIRKREQELEALEIKTKYEHQWLKESEKNNLFYIIEFITDYEFKYLYLVKNYPESTLGKDLENNISIGIAVGHGKLTDCFENIQVVDADEVGSIITQYKDDIDTLINETLKETKDE